MLLKASSQSSTSSWALMRVILYKSLEDLFKDSWQHERERVKIQQLLCLPMVFFGSILKTFPYFCLSLSTGRVPANSTYNWFSFQDCSHEALYLFLPAVKGWEVFLQI